VFFKSYVFLQLKQKNEPSDELLKHDSTLENVS